MRGNHLEINSWKTPDLHFTKPHFSLTSTNSLYCILLNHELQENILNTLNNNFTFLLQIDQISNATGLYSRG